MPITKDQARELARAFLAMSHTLGEFRFDNWDDLTPAQRKSVEDAEWSLINLSSDLTTAAVGIALDDMQPDLKALQDATAKAQAVIADIQRVKDVLALATKAIALGGALISRNPGAIGEAAKGLFDAAKSIQS